jgi:flagellar FliL protein
MAAKKEEKKPEDQGPPSPSKLPLVILILVALNMGGTGFVAYMAMNPKAPPPPEAPPPGPADDPLAVWGPTVDLDSFVVNLNEPTSTRYLRCRIQVELADDKASERFERMRPVLRNELLGYLSNLTVEQTLGSQAKETIRSDLMARITEKLGPEHVKRLFFSEFVVQ